jgi:hypothetical protein
VWCLGIAAAALCGGLAAAWWVQRRMARLLAVEHDQRARDAHSARAEVAQLRYGLAGEYAVQAAAAVIDNALQNLGSQEREQ